jgi:hypothetical protein
MRAGNRRRRAGLHTGRRRLQSIGRGAGFEGREQEKRSSVEGRRGGG